MVCGWLPRYARQRDASVTRGTLRPRGAIGAQGLFFARTSVRTGNRGLAPLGLGYTGTWDCWRPWDSWTQSNYSLTVLTR